MKTNFLKNALHLLSSSVVSQLILLIATPILTRMYLPQDFGELALFVSINTFLAALFTLKYDLSIMLPKSRLKAKTLTILTLSSSSFFSFFLFLLLVILYIFGYLKIEFILLPFVIIIVTLVTIMQQWSARKNNYKIFSYSQVVNAVCNILISLLYQEYFYSGLNGLIIGFAFGYFMSVLFLLVRNRDEFSIRLKRKKILFNSILRLAKNFNRFPRIILPTQLILLSATTFQPILLSFVFSVHEIGLYSLASRLLMVPTILLSSSVGEFFKVKLVDNINQNKAILPFIFTLMKYLVLASLCIFGVLYIGSEFLFDLFFGHNYRESGVIASYLCFGIFAYFITQPYYYLFIAISEEKLGFYMQIFSSLFPLIALFLSGFVFNFYNSILFYSFSILISNLIYMVFIYYAALKYDRKYRESAIA
jgi:O-antigen/teichoic acid export membrane protein